MPQYFSSPSDIESRGAFYRNLGVKRVINASSWITRVGGSIMPSAVLDAMEEASYWFVDMNELNMKAGETIARLAGAEAGMVTAGSAAGMLLEAASCMTGMDPARVRRLPDTIGMKNEIVIKSAFCQIQKIFDSVGRILWKKFHN